MVKNKVEKIFFRFTCKGRWAYNENLR